MVEQLPGRLVGPVDVLDHQHEGAVLGGYRQQRGDRLEQPQLRLGRIRRFLRRRSAAELGKDLAELRAHGPEPLRELVDVD